MSFSTAKLSCIGKVDEFIILPAAKLAMTVGSGFRSAVGRFETLLDDIIFLKNSHAWKLASVLLTTGQWVAHKTLQSTGGAPMKVASKLAESDLPSNISGRIVAYGVGGELCAAFTRSLPRTSWTQVYQQLVVFVDLAAFLYRVSRHERHWDMLLHSITAHLQCRRCAVLPMYLCPRAQMKGRWYC